MVAKPAMQAEAVLVRGPPDGLCLDFANTRFWRGTASPTETLQAPADLLLWCEQTGGLDQGEVQRIRERWQAGPEEGARVLSAAVGLREALYRIFSAVAVAAVLDGADLETFNSGLGMAPNRARLRLRPEGYAWELPTLPAGLGLLLAPVLWSGGDLLAGGRLGRVRQCANPQCRWLFVDDSKSGNRRWCSMASCGNRAKAHRHYAKSKEVEGKARALP